jgi:hypothetical protein
MFGVVSWFVKLFVVVTATNTVLYVLFYILVGVSDIIKIYNGKAPTDIAQ